jgi:hypothetical protein
MAISNDQELVKAVAQASNLVQEIHDYCQRQLREESKISFPRGLIGTADSYRGRSPRTSRLIRSAACAYGFMYLDVLWWLLSRTDLASVGGDFVPDLLCFPRRWQAALQNGVCALVPRLFKRSSAASEKSFVVGMVVPRFGSQAGTEDRHGQLLREIIGFNLFGKDLPVVAEKKANLIATAIDIGTVNWNVQTVDDVPKWLAKGGKSDEMPSAPTPRAGAAR